MWKLCSSSIIIVAGSSALQNKLNTFHSTTVRASNRQVLKSSINTTNVIKKKDWSGGLLGTVRQCKNTSSKKYMYIQKKYTEMQATFSWKQLVSDNSCAHSSVRVARKQWGSSFRTRLFSCTWYTYKCRCWGVVCVCAVTAPYLHQFTYAKWALLHMLLENSVSSPVLLVSLCQVFFVCCQSQLQIPVTLFPLHYQLKYPNPNRYKVPCVYSSSSTKNYESSFLKIRLLLN